MSDSCVERKPKCMPCFCAGPPFVIHLFNPAGDNDYCCSECGWYQTSTAGGAAELCTSATWYEDTWDVADDDSESGRILYNRLRRIAINGGYDVPESPNNWVAINEEE